MGVKTIDRELRPWARGRRGLLEDCDVGYGGRGGQREGLAMAMQRSSCVHDFLSIS